jgi:hypothetical protein
MMMTNVERRTCRTKGAGSYGRFMSSISRVQWMKRCGEVLWLTSGWLVVGDVSAHLPCLLPVTSYDGVLLRMCKKHLFVTFR